MYMYVNKVVSIGFYQKMCVYKIGKKMMHIGILYRLIMKKEESHT